MIKLLKSNRTALFGVMFLFFSSCEKQTQPKDIILGENQAMYHLVFREADQDMVSEWIDPHLASLIGTHVKTISLRGISGNGFEVMRIVNLEKDDNRSHLLNDNAHVLDDLRKKVDFDVDIYLPSSGVGAHGRIDVE